MGRRPAPARRGRPVEAGLQDRGDRAVGARADGQPALAGRLEPDLAVGLGQPQDAQARPEALLGMRLGAHDRLDQRGRAGPDLGGKGQHPRRRPAGVAPMRARHVLGRRRVPPLQGRPGMGRDALAGVEDLDRRVGDARLDHLADQPRRHRVVMAVHLDVVVGRDPAAPPFGVGVGLRRQRQQRRPVDRLEELAAAGAELAHQPGVQVAQHLPDRLVQLAERQEAAVAQPRQDEPLDDQHRDLDLRLVARPAHPGRQDGGAVMGGHLLVGAVDAGLVAAGCGHAGAQVVADQQLRRAAEEGERVDVGADPVRQPLAPAGLGVGVVRRAEHGDEHMRPPFLAGRPVEHRHGVAGVVDEQLLAGDMGLAHRRADAAPPRDVEVAEPAVAVAVRMLGAVFLPEQQQRHAAATQLGMNVVPVRHRPRRRRHVEAGRREQPPLQLGVVDLGRHRPGDPDHRRPPQILADRRVPDPDRARDRPHARAARILQPQNLSNFPHRQSLGWHRVPLGRRTTLPVMRSSTSAPKTLLRAVRDQSESLSGFRRNQCPPCVGITVRLASESPVRLGSDSAACTNGWANYRLLAACTRLQQAEFIAPTTASSPVCAPPSTTSWSSTTSTWTQWRAAHLGRPPGRRRSRARP